MRPVAGSILILAASTLISAGIIVDGINHSRGGYGVPGYVLGGIMVLIGLFVCLSGVEKRDDDERPIDDEKSAGSTAEKF